MRNSLSKPHGCPPGHNPGASWSFHKAAMSYLQTQGWTVQPEYQQDYINSNGILVHGFIDIWAEKHGVTLAVECDDYNPRKKSLAKLITCKADICIVLCRRGKHRKVRIR